MEYCIARGQEVCRLDSAQVERLHSHELREFTARGYDRVLGTYAEVNPRPVRCLYPHEIHAMFGLQLSKEVYLMPENDTVLSVHNQRLRNDFRKYNLIPPRGDLSVLRIDEVHEFDTKIRQLSDELKIDFVYRGKQTKKLRDEVE